MSTKNINVKLLRQMILPRLTMCSTKVQQLTTNYQTFIYTRKVCVFGLTDGAVRNTLCVYQGMCCAHAAQGAIMWEMCVSAL